MTSAVLVTGLGVITPTGVGLDRHWAGVSGGRSGLSRMTRFDVSRYSAKIAGQITGFDASQWIPKRLLTQTDVSTRYALAAARMALDDSAIDLTQLDDFDIGVVTSNATGGFEFTHREFRKLWAEGPEFVSVYESFAWFYAVNSGQISIRHGMRGPGRAVVAENAGGLDALGQAERLVRHGTRAVVTGGVDSALDPWGWVSHQSTGQTSTDENPDSAYLPFDRRAHGYVPGEGGALLVLESAETARARGAPCYGEVAGYASTFDPAPGTGRPPTLRLAAQKALDAAGLLPRDISVVFADSAGVPSLDEAEARTITELFGPYGVPVAAPKALTGRLYSGAGPVDVATALLSIRHDLIPPTTAATRISDRYQLDLVGPTARRASVSTALVLARGKGGFNAALVLRETS